MEKVKEGIVLEFLHLEFTSHVQSYPSHTWTDFDDPLGSEKSGTRKPLRTTGVDGGLGWDVDTPCSLLHFGEACLLRSTSQRPVQRLFWVNLGQRELPSAAVSLIRGHIQLLVENQFQPFKKAAQTQQTSKPGQACPMRGADS